ncbi:hypothetical protein LSPH24S_06528 [Lysinibacillus sphaericus]
MYKLEKSIEIEQHGNVQCAHGKVAVQGIGTQASIAFMWMDS